ncbi:hypothetical protein [Kitasatospora sp. NPDC001132]
MSEPQTECMWFADVLGENATDEDVCLLSPVEGDRYCAVHAPMADATDEIESAARSVKETQP